MVIRNEFGKPRQCPNIYNYRSLPIESWQKGLCITFFLIVLKSPELFNLRLLHLPWHPLLCNFETTGKHGGLVRGLLLRTKKEWLLLTRWLTNVTLSFLCKRCTFTDCHPVFVYGTIEILRIIHQTWENKARSAVLIFLVTARQLHKDQPYENFIKVHFKSWAVTGLPAKGVLTLHKLSN